MKSRRILGSLIALTLGAQAAHAESLTPEQALERARRANPDLAAAIADLEAARAEVRAADRARAVPVLRASIDGQHAERFSPTGDGVAQNSDDTISASVDVTHTTAIGTALVFGFDFSNRWSHSNASRASASRTSRTRDLSTTEGITLGPNQSALLTLGVRQPLLKGAGAGPVLSPLRQAQARARAASAAQLAAASQVAHDVLVAYGELWYAQESLAVEDAALALTERQLADTETRVNILKTVPEIDRLRLATERASRRQRVLAAKATVTQRQLTLARLMALEMAAARTLVAAKPPAPEATTAPIPRVEALIARAEAASLELAQARAGLDQAKERVRLASDDALPRLDLTGTLSGGAIRTDDGAASGFPGGRPAIVAMIGLEFEWPVGASTADANLDAARADLRAAQARYQSKKDQLGAQIASLESDLATTQAALELAVENVKVASDLAARENAQLALGTVLLTEVISAQQTAREAELTRLRALVDIAASALELDHLTGDLLARRLTAAPTEPTP